MKKTRSLPLLTVVITILACILLVFGGLGYFLAMVSATYWLGGFVWQKLSKPSSNRETVVYGKAIQAAWYFIGGLWILLTIAALRYANISLLDMVKLIR